MPAVKIAFIEDLGPANAEALILPAQHAAELAVSNAELAGGLPSSVELVPVDVSDDGPEARQAVDDIATDPSFVGAIVAPYLEDQASVAVPLDRAGIATLSLSSRRSGLRSLGLSGWFDLVASRKDEADALAAAVDRLASPGRGVCLLAGSTSDDARWASRLTNELKTPVALDAETPETEDAVDAVVPKITDAGCGAVVWGDSAEVAVTLRREMAEAGLRKIPLLGGDQLKQDAYPLEAGRAGEGTIAACPCVDLSTSTRLAAQRFIQDYQSQFGSPPGAYAAESWDSARIFAGLVRDGATDRAAVSAALARSGTYRGLAHAYRFRPGDGLEPSSAAIHLYRDEGGRWIETVPVA
jgi:ABC-type branched-subunit amino acid transport system substrate-binding protein